MPLIHKPRDLNYGVKKSLKRNVIRRKPIHAWVIPETLKYIETKSETMSRGQVVDVAIAHYAKCRELSETSAEEKAFVKREILETTVSSEALAYIQFMRSAMTPGELIDAAIQLYQKLSPEG